jgi:imidazolonepropionase-like amidohydrolase
MKIKFALPVLCAAAILAIAPTPVDWSSPATAAETESGIVELIRHPKSSADHQKLVKWYEQREDEVRHQAEFYRKLAQDYQGYNATAITTACEEIARYYDEIAQQFEKLAEQHRHLAAHAP